MLKRPSSRRKSKKDQVELNLVPFIDAMVTLIGFMLFTTSFLAIVSIESPFPQTSPSSNQQKLLEKPLQLTVSIREKESEIWSPFERIPSKLIPHTEEGKPDIQAIHEALFPIKQQFPDETKIVIVPAARTTYDLLISLMDGLRTVEPTDPPLFRKNPATGIDEAVKTLFPEVIFGNLLGDT
ncbi:MAG TPA: hypothetical protein DCS07_03925 [Bdellovibrionales bacterium]|nr:MAG: hypothetical protein A2Z97_12590 [Bdellovibrionales bacterium GWB1_52_6]OFZ04160.1 MAG: hypothetical protein A2X97_15290 [Bdellovibrionales bacterium GWA1_52_35]OFZ33286.1 MAG: hypothetical protein A2070_14640 [Bdellovibrionales bacterium GWC1_52_8]HAR41766.1 hypothetical protein [Bdellovibrionales bacterium]HCM40502.1 hypothetical protein [Bdellovibrionales bacterium]